MGGTAVTPSAKGARKALDAAINLVPFIDLLSCCISFLLITAVWSQVATLEVSPSSSGATAGQEPPPSAAWRLTLLVEKSGYLLSRSTGEQESIPRSGGELDRVKLAVALRGAHAARPDLHDLEIRAGDAVAYDEVVRTMDTALGERFVGLTLRGRDEE